MIRFGGMKGNKMSDQQDLSIDKYVFWLRVCVVLAVVLEISEEVSVFFSDYPVGFMVNGDIWLRKISEFGLEDRFILFDLTNLATVSWFFVLYQFWVLSSLYKQGKIFTSENALCFKYSGWGLLRFLRLKCWNCL